MRMIPLQSVVGACAMALAALLAVPASADELPKPSGPYTGLATIVAGEMRLEMRMWVDGANRRSEGEVNGEGQVIIVRGDQGRIYMLNPERREGMSMPITPEAAGIEDQMYGWTAAREGSETIGGVDATRYSVAGDSPLGGQLTGQLWFDSDGVLIKARTESVVNGETVIGEHLLTDVKLGPVDPALFEPPSDYQIMSLGG